MDTNFQSLSSDEATIYYFYNRSILNFSLGALPSTSRGLLLNVRIFEQLLFNGASATGKHYLVKLEAYTFGTHKSLQILVYVSC